MTTRVRVLLLDMTGITADIIRHVIDQQEDMAIVPSSPVDPAPEADVVIASHSTDRAAMRRLDCLLAARPEIRALTVESHGRAAFLYTLVPRSSRLGPLSPETLVEFIRGPR